MASTKALQHRITYMERTTETKNEDFSPIALAVKHKLIPAITGRPVHDSYEEVFALPVRLGGLAQALLPRALSRILRSLKKRHLTFHSRYDNEKNGT